MLALLVMGLTSLVRPGKPVTNQVTTTSPLRPASDPARHCMWPDVRVPSVLLPWRTK